MRRTRLPLAFVFSLCASAGAGDAVERAPAQKAGLPPPYYASRYGATTTSHRFLSIEEAIAAALAQASDYRQARLGERIAEEDVSQAKAAQLPVISGGLSYSGNTPAPDTTPRVPSFAPSNGIHETAALLNATGTVDVAGRLRATLRHTRDLLSAARAGTRSAERNLVLATVDAYYGLSFARQKRRLADEALSLAESFSEATRERVETGRAGDNDLLRARAEALRRRDELEQARAAESAGEDGLRALTGIGPGVHISVSRPSSELPPLPEAGAVEEVLRLRPQMQQIRALAAASEEDAAAARAERRPELTYALSAGFDATEQAPLRRYVGAAALVGLTIPVTNFGASRSREAQARLRDEAFEMQYQSTLRALRQEYYSSRAQALAAVQRITEAKARATASEDNLNTLLGEYRDGKAAITELLDAQSAYADARTAYYQAIIDYDTARVRLAADPAQAGFAAAPVGQPMSWGMGCERTLAEAPALGGLRLGMDTSELQARFGTLPSAAADAAGVASLELPGSALALPAPDDAAFAISHVSLRLLEGRVYSIRAVYSGDTTWETKDAFLAAAAERLSLPDAPWKAFYDWSDKTLGDTEDLRDLALECRDFRVRVGLGFFSEGVRRVLTPHVKLDETRATRLVEARQAELRRKTEAGKP